VVAAVAASWLAKPRVDQVWPLAISLVLWLPFVPGPVPKAFLIWQGPIEAVVWAIVIVGLLAASPAIVPRALGDHSVAPWMAGMLVLTWSLYAFSSVRDVVPGGDEPHYLAATQSLLHDGDLKVANNYADGEYLEYFGGRLEPHFLRRSTSGEIYSIHAPGVSVIVLPAFAIAGYQGAVFTMVLIAALTAALTWRLAYRISGSAAGAWIGVLGVFATTPYLFHSFTIYPEIIGSLLVIIGVWLLIELSDGRVVSDATLIVAGFALAILPWLHSRFAVIAGMLGLLIIFRLLQRSGARRRIGLFVIAPVIAGIGWFAFFYVIWGSPSPAAPYGPDTGTSASNILRGLIGLTFDQQFGALTAAPIYVMAAAGAYALFFRQSRLAIELLLIVVPYAAAVASFAMWWAGNAAPARFLVAVLPVASLLIAMVGTSPSAILLVTVSVALAVPRALIEGGRFIFNNRSGLDATIEWLTRSVDLSLALPSVHRDGESIAVRDGLIWVVVFFTATVVAAVLAKRKAAGVRFGYASIGAAVSTLMCATMVWALHGRNVVTPDRSKLAAFAAYRPSLHRAPQGFLDRLALDVTSPSRVNRLPAGEYRLANSDTWSMKVGRNDQPIAFSGDRLRLPVMLQSPTLSASMQQLIPVATVPPVFSRPATHAAQFRTTRLFAFDEHVYLERDGLWTRANEDATVVIDAGAPAPGGLVLSVTAGAVATSLRLKSGVFDRTLSLAPGQQQTVTLPPSSVGTWALAIRSGAGFRPSERESGNRDVRLLAAWIAVASQ